MNRFHARCRGRHDRRDRVRCDSSRLVSPRHASGATARGRYLLKDLLFLGKPSHRLLVPDQVAVDPDLVGTPVPLDKLRLDTEPLPRLDRQTGGPREVVSLAAVLDS